ncbi:hypothetical protein Tco_1247191 [Tanacetum coccineum]
MSISSVLIPPRMSISSFSSSTPISRISRIGSPQGPHRHLIGSALGLVSGTYSRLTVQWVGILSIGDP